MISLVCRDFADLREQRYKASLTLKPSDVGIVWPMGYEVYPCLLLIAQGGQRLLGLRHRDSELQKDLFRRGLEDDHMDG